MLVYWSFVLVPALLSLAQRRGQSLRSQLLPMAALFVALFFFLALRETGGDYFTYVQLYELIQQEDLLSAGRTIEPLYGVLNWASAQLDLGIYGVNAVCALLFLGCLFQAAVKERHPLLLLTLAVPYFVIVVGMGYTRQGVAAALILTSVVLLREGRTGGAAIAILVASGFHFSAFAALALPIVAASKERRGFMRLVLRILLLGIIAVAAQSFFIERFDTYSENYIQSDRYESGGAFLRSIVTGAAALVFFYKRRQYQNFPDYTVWRPFAVLGLACVPLSLIASTAVDRVGLYLIPFQLITFSRFPLVVNGGRSFNLLKFVIVSAYLLYFFVWLHLGNYADELWVPYRWIFSEPG